MLKYVKAVPGVLKGYAEEIELCLEAGKYAGAVRATVLTAALFPILVVEIAREAEYGPDAPTVLPNLLNKVGRYL